MKLDINHILSNGDLETHYYLEERLLKLHNLQPVELPAAIQLTLFGDISAQSIINRPREDLLQEAYQKQGEQIAYVEKQDTHDQFN